MENDSLKNIEKYLFEMVTYMRISILIGIISVVYLIYTINTSKAYLGESVSDTTSTDTNNVVVKEVLTDEQIAARYELLKYKDKSKYPNLNFAEGEVQKEVLRLHCIAYPDKCEGGQPKRL